MKKTIGMVLALCMMGCTAQPAQLPNHHEKQEKTKDILQFLPKEEKEPVDINVGLSISMLGNEFSIDWENPALDSISKQYQEDNLANVSQDLYYLQRTVYRDAVNFYGDEEQTNLNWLILAIETDARKANRLEEILKVLEPLENATGENAVMGETSTEFVIEGEEIKLSYETIKYANFYRGEDVKRLYETLYGESLDLSLYEKETDEFYYVVRYDSANDLFTYCDFRDGAIVGFRTDHLYVIDMSENEDELTLQCALINTEYNFLTGSTHIFENSGLPILKRHYSSESSADNVYTISEILEDQPNQFDTFTAKAKKNEDGTYTLESLTQTNSMHEAEGDIIFYNNYETEDGNVVFLPLFDCTACKRFNDVILRYYYHDSSYTNQLYFYEDDSIAAVFVKKNNSNGVQSAYIYDKLHHQPLAPLSEEQAKKYIDVLKERDPDLSEEIQIYRYEVNGQTILEIYINGEIRRIVLE